MSRNHKRFVGQSLMIQYRPADCARMGLTLSRKFGSAIKRNRFKRLAREAFRHLAEGFPQLEIVIMPKKGCSSFSFDGITHDLKTLASEYAQSSTAKSR